MQNDLPAQVTDAGIEFRRITAHGCMGYNKKITGTNKEEDFNLLAISIAALIRVTIAVIMNTNEY